MFVFWYVWLLLGISVGLSIGLNVRLVARLPRWWPVVTWCVAGLVRSLVRLPRRPVCCKRIGGSTGALVCCVVGWSVGRLAARRIVVVVSYPIWCVCVLAVCRPRAACVLLCSVSRVLCVVSRVVRMRSLCRSWVGGAACDCWLCCVRVLFVCWLLLFGPLLVSVPAQPRPCAGASVCVCGYV